MNKLKLIYVAAPFFLAEQIDIVEKIEKLLESIDLKYFSPRKECLFKKSDAPEKAKKTFKANIDAIKKSNLIIAVIDDFDPGTVFEMGYAYGMKKDILAYSDTPDRKINLMLGQSCIGFSNGNKDLVNKLVRIDSNNYQKKEFEGQNI